MRESKAYQEIMEEGEANAHRRDVLDVAASRFGPRDATSLNEVLQSVLDIKKLQALHGLALRCLKIEDLIRVAKR